MKLECASFISSKNATEQEIINAFLDDTGRGEFITLYKDDQIYMLAFGEFDDLYILHYREGDKDNHFKCINELNKSEVEKAFLKYLKGDDTWKTDYQWEKMEIKPWWKFW